MVKEKSTILIVDDEPLNLKLLRGFLVPRGYRVEEAGSGRDALEKAKEKPDLILLDILMPGIDGFATCRRIRENDLTKDIPIIFLSALQDEHAKLSGFEVGGVDYVTKPFQPQELLARVRTHLTILEQERKLREYSAGLEKMVEERTRQLIHAERLAVLGTFAAALCHEINNACTAVVGGGHFMQSGLQEVSEYLCAQQGNGDTTKVLSAVKSMGENLKLLSTGSNSIVNLVNRFKDYARKGESEREKHPLVEIIDGALFLLRHRIKQGVAVSKTVDAGLNVLCDHQEMTQVFMNLFNNSIDAMERNSGAIEVEAKPEDGNVLVFVRDTGGGIPEELAGEVFKPFFTTKGKAQGTGLGLFIVKHIIEDHGGSVALETGAEKGAAFKIVLPLG